MNSRTSDRSRALPWWDVVEQRNVPKQAGRGEDRLVVIDGDSGVSCAAVIDGVTDKSGRDYGGMTGGARAADCVAASLRRLPPDTPPQAAADAMTTDLARLRRSWGIADDDPLAPAAVAAVFLPAQGVIWRVGDVHVAIGRGARWETRPADKLIDRVLAGTRAAYLHCLLAEGHDLDELIAEDVGRALVLPVLKRQSLLANCEHAGPFGYGVLDGRPVPARFVEVIHLDQEVDQVVLASDGYLSPAGDLATAERELAESLRADPMRIGVHAATKGLAPAATSFDDRAYIRLQTSQRPGPG
jgi:hypothetical protein